jgi:hypothetical protein
MEKKLEFEKNLEERTRIIKKIYGKVPTNISSIKKPSDNEKLNILSDVLFLDYILNQSNINLEDITNRSVEEELQFWDRKNLLYLVDNINNYLIGEDKQGNLNKDKLKFIIEHSIKGDLTQTLAFSKDNPYSVYNSFVIDSLKENKINLDKWLLTQNKDKNRIIIVKNYNHDDYFALIMKQWSRNFRTSFSIGDISECCISTKYKDNIHINENNINEKKKRIEKEKTFKTIILDYFLDLSIQIAHIRVLKEGEKEKKIGQIYFVALDSLGRKKYNSKNQMQLINQESGICLGVSSVEIKPQYKNNDNLVPLISSAIISKDGFASNYSFKSALIGDRFSLFRQYLKTKEECLKTLKSQLTNKKRDLKQKKNSIYALWDDAIETKENYLEIRRDLDYFNNSLQEISSQIDNNYKRHSFKVRKLGLNKAIANNCKYLGTNYLDLFARSDHEGFFMQNNINYLADGFLLTEKSIFDELEEKTIYFRKKYSKYKKNN